MTEKKRNTSALDWKALMEGQKDFLKPLVQEVVQQVLEAEMAEAVEAERYERTGERKSYRSGYYRRGLITRVGRLELRVPQDREGRFSTELFARYQRSEQALVAALAEMYVQGDDAPDGIVSALQALNRVAAPDVILLARGGGSIEDLWAFNDEKIVRAVIDSSAPVITGVGHETDFTLADFAADLRAPTPTAAAELATPLTVLDLKSSLAGIGSLLVGGITTQLAQQRESAGWLDNRLRLVSPARRLQTERQRLDEMSRRWNAAQIHSLQFAGQKFKGLENRLLALSPLAVLRRGYAVITKNEKVVTSTSQIQVDDALHVRIQDGEFNARVTGNG